MDHNILKRVIFDQHEVIKNAVIVDRNIQFEELVNYVLIGIRRAGKSTLLYKRVQDLISSGVEWKQIIYINFDDERLYGFSLSDFDDILLVAEELSSKKHYYFFDEIQNIDGWERFARRVADQKLKVDITGSNAKMLSSEINKQLGGRYITKEILPFTFEEYLCANNIKKEISSIKNVGRINALLEQYFTYGGFPESLLFKNRREYVSSIYQKVLFGDIISHNNIRNINGMKLLIRKIAESIGKEISFSRLQNLITGIGYKLSKDVIIDYSNYCKSAFLLFTIENYYAKFIDKTSTPKYYFMDNGLLNLFITDKKTSLLENIVAIHLYRLHKESLYYLNGNKVNIDFYLDDIKTVIQVAYSIKEIETYEREVTNLINFATSNDQCKLIIVTYDEEQTIQMDKHIINVIPLKKFLIKSPLQRLDNNT